MIKYFQPNMNNLQVFQGHGESIRDVTWAPNDARFATGSDDGTIKIWNFEMMREEKTLTGEFEGRHEARHEARRERRKLIATVRARQVMDGT